MFMIAYKQMNTLSYNWDPCAPAPKKEEPFIPMLESRGFLAQAGKSIFVSLKVGINICCVSLIVLRNLGGREYPLISILNNFQFFHGLISFTLACGDQTVYDLGSPRQAIVLSQLLARSLVTKR